MGTQGGGSARDDLLELLAMLRPWDELERRHLAEVREWIHSGAPLYRTEKPDVPARHLVSYFVAVDEVRARFLLVAHRTSGLLLPTGGHVEPMEDPWTAVGRECQEELGIEAVPTERFGPRPLFVTATPTRGAGRHIDVSLWYVVRADATTEISYDEGEFDDISWLTPQAILAMPADTLDPHMSRFLGKYQAAATGVGSDV